MISLAGVVIIYNPDSKLAARLETYLDYLQHLYVVDNSEKRNCHLPSSDKITYIGDGENKGIAARLNQIAELAIQKGYHWLLTMDQDSFFTKDSFLQYARCIDNFGNHDQVAMFGIQFQNKFVRDTHCEFDSKPQLITSGSIINLKNFPLTKGFDEALFIDQVDFDFCYRASLLGFKNIQFLNIYMEHSLGNKSNYISLKTGKKTIRSLHAPSRLYYMTRNYLYVHSKYKNEFPNEIRHTKKDLLNRIKNNLLYGREKFAVCKYIIKGYLDFKRNRMGKMKGS